jgi:formate dehydrogenase beta subunit
VIIPALHERQNNRGGYLTQSDMREVAKELAVPLHRVYSLVTFFPHFRTSPPKEVEVQVCRDMACHLRGSVAMQQELHDWAKQQFGDKVDVCGVSCLGRCDRAPAAIVNENRYLARNVADLKAVIESYFRNQPVKPDTDLDDIKQRSLHWEMDCYGGNCNYDAVRQYIKNPNPESILKVLETAGLLGMGGAGGRAYKKWADVLKATGENKFVVCNADESEPGTFKDRDILLATPYLTVEGMILGGLVVGATQGWVYIRHEYPEQIAQVEAEIFRAKQLGVLGRNLLGSQKSFELAVFISPGGYICGEQTALIEAMENKRAEPRNRPPELMTNGYLNQPTLLNNVETFAWVPTIVLRDAGKWYAEQGRKNGPWVGRESEKMRGKRLFSVSGDVAKPGVYEVPTGIPLGELIDHFCGGMADGKELIAVALSGPSGGLLPAKIPVSLLNKRFAENLVPADVTEFDVREIPLDINVARAMDIMIGAGIVIYGTGANVIAEALACSRFFRNESCGKCVPCRIGSEKITQMGDLLNSGQLQLLELGQFRDTANQLAGVMAATSICGLGQVASNPVRNVLNYFPELVVQACNRNKTSDSSKP